MGDEDDYGEDSSGLFDPEDAEGLDVEAFLEESEALEERWLEQELERIEEQLEKRDDIHNTIVGELEWKIEFYADRIDRSTSRWRGKSEEVEELKRRIQDLYEELSDEYREHWRDRQRLEDERRQVLRELDRVTSDYLSDI